jgi:hypothetical protein
VKSSVPIGVTATPEGRGKSGGKAAEALRHMGSRGDFEGSILRRATAAKLECCPDRKKQV